MMERFYRMLVKHPRVVTLAFLLAAGVSLLCWPMVDVNYDMNDYLPPESASTIALDTLGEEYDGGIPNARVLVRNVTIPEALDIKEQLRQIDGVTEITWLDDSVSVLQPLEVIDQKLLETYYQEESALYSLVIAEDKRVQAIEDIRALVGDDNAVTGAAASTADATTSTVTQIMKIAIVAVIFVLCILLLTTTSWLEPFIVLGSLGVAIVINSGSNLIFGEISFVSNAAGPVLQLAVSLDYSVFLLHRFEECRASCPDRREAMVQALCKSTSSILSSGLTTVIGFLALCLMQFQIGPDLGLVLAKGVAISLLTVFLFSPVLILQCSGLLDRLRHRSLMPSFQGFGRFVTRAMLPAAAVFTLLIFPCNRAQGSNDYYYGSGKIFGPETRLGADTQEVEDVFGQSDTYVLMVPKGNTAREQELSTAIRAVDKVSDVLSFVDNAGASIPMEFLDEKTRSLLISENYSRMVISVAADPEGEETFALIQQLRDIAQSYYPDEWLMAGEGVSTLDLKETVTSDMTLVNLLAIGAVFVVLLLSFRSLSLPVILVLAIENAIWINLSIPYFRGQTIFYLSYLIISSIQLGATVDYAILFTDRYLENRRTMARREAIIETVSAVTVSVLTSGLTLTVVGFLLGYISTHGLLSQLGMFLGVGTICSMLIVLLALPGLLYLLDDLIRRTTRGAVFYGEGKGAVRKASRKTARKAARDSRLDSGNPFDMPPEQAAVPWDTPVAAFDSGNPFDMPPAQAAAPWGAPAAALDSDNPFAAPPAQAAAPWSAPAAALDSDNPFATPPAQESAPRPAPAAPSASGNPFDMPPAQEPAPRPAPAAPSAGGNPFDMPPAQEAAPRPAPAAPSAGGNPFDMPPAQEPAPRPAPAAPSASGNPFDMPPAQEPAPRPAPAAPSASGNPFDMPPAQEPAPRPAYDVNRNNPFYIP